MIHLERPIVFIDLETTGTETLSDRIVELAALKINTDGREELLTTRINPQIAIPPEAMAVHGITDNDVKDSPTFKEFAPRLVDFLKDCDIAGYNVRRFDLEVLEAEFRRADVQFTREGRHIVDVQMIYHKFHPRDLAAAHKQYLGKEMEGRHGAEKDARATADIFREQINIHSDLPRTVKELHDFTAERRSKNWIDTKGRFVWVDGVVYVNFAKYRGKTLEYIARNEPGFLDWIVRSDFLDDAKKIARDALEGIMPKK